jgi:hypothetical protein
MGAYLSTPVTDKEVEEGEGANLQYGVAAMQGWRRTMEDGADAHGAASWAICRTDSLAACLWMVYRLMVYRKRRPYGLAACQWQ